MDSFLGDLTHFSKLLNNINKATYTPEHLHQGGSGTFMQNKRVQTKINNKRRFKVKGEDR